ncbi:hypothetical protein BCSAG_53500 [Bacillus cereus]
MITGELSSLARYDRIDKFCSFATLRSFGVKLKVLLQTKNITTANVII